MKLKYWGLLMQLPIWLLMGYVVFDAIVNQSLVQSIFFTSILTLSIFGFFTSIKNGGLK